TSPTMKVWHPISSWAATPASSGQRSSRHEIAAASPFLQSDARHAPHHWRQPPGETLLWPGYGLHTIGWHVCGIRLPHPFHPLETRRYSGAVAAVVNQQTDGDSGTSAARCPGARGTGWRVRDIPAFLARKQSHRAERHHKASPTFGRG